MAYKVPLNVCRELRGFLDELFDVVFSEVAVASVVGSLDIVHGLGFGDS